MAAVQLCTPDENDADTAEDSTRNLATPPIALTGHRGISEPFPFLKNVMLQVKMLLRIV